MRRQMPLLQFLCIHLVILLVADFRVSAQDGLSKVIIHPKLNSFINETTGRSVASLNIFNVDDIVSFFASSGVDVNIQDRDGNTILHMISRIGNIEALQILLRRGVSVNKKNKAGVIPLYWAASRGYLDFVRLMVDAGANVNSRDDNGHSPIFPAASDGQAQTVQFLLQRGTLPNHQNIYGETALMLAVSNNQLEVTRILLLAGADVNLQTIRGVSALGFAGSDGEVNIVQLLLDEGATVDLEDINKFTPLLHYSDRSFPDPVKLLLDNGANVNHQNDIGETSLAIAASEAGNVEIGKILLAAQAVVDLPDNEGMTPLMKAAAAGDVEMIRILLKEGASHTRRNMDGYTALSFAAKEGKLDTLKELLAVKTDVTFHIKGDETLLSLSVGNNHIRVTRFLLQSGAPLNDQFSDGSTILMKAVKLQLKGMVVLLLEQCPDVDIQSNDGKSASAIATEKGFTDIQAILRDHKNLPCFTGSQIHPLGDLKREGCRQVRCCHGTWTATGAIFEECGERCHTLGTPAGYCTLVGNCPQLVVEFQRSGAVSNKELLSDFVRNYGCGRNRVGQLQVCCPVA